MRVLLLSRLVCCLPLHCLVLQRRLSPRLLRHLGVQPIRDLQGECREGQGRDLGVYSARRPARRVAATSRERSSKALDPCVGNIPFGVSDSKGVSSDRETQSHITTYLVLTTASREVV